ncbi:unnamed protein product [Adineta steineri]|uniref:Prolyl 4-hydroxylase alpha subunit domain-containing protein n=1 Tax=Adineta steineri TaxID=433720 RepID=A0A814W1U9_9BILA|nr:unnamed protein product [Adineta steineri]
MTTFSGKIVKRDVNLPNREDEGKLAFLIFNVLTPDECQQRIELSEQRSYSEATVNGYGFSELMTDFRNSDRCIIDDVQMAEILFQRIESFLPKTWKNYELVSLNERLRFLRYDPGQFFAAHMDGEYHRSNGSGEQSFLTIQLYLNEGYQGGATTFIHNTDSNKNVRCVPRTGMVLVFEHRLFHEGSILIEGRKYTVRTDVMYRPKIK